MSDHEKSKPHLIEAVITFDGELSHADAHERLLRALGDAGIQIAPRLFETVALDPERVDKEGVVNEADFANFARRAASSGIWEYRQFRNGDDLAHLLWQGLAEAWLDANRDPEKWNDMVLAHLEYGIVPGSLDDIEPQEAAVILRDLSWRNLRELIGSVHYPNVSKEEREIAARAIKIIGYYFGGGLPVYLLREYVYNRLRAERRI